MVDITLMGKLLIYEDCWLKYCKLLAYTLQLHWQYLNFFAHFSTLQSCHKTLSIKDMKGSTKRHFNHNLKWRIPVDHFFFLSSPHCSARDFLQLLLFLTVCGTGYYGDMCKKACSEHCAGEDNSCHHVNGSCDLGCDAGYQSALCTKGVILFNFVV